MPTPSDSSKKDGAPDARPATAENPPRPADKKKSAKEARLAEALRANLRRRKSGAGKSKDD